MLFVFICCTVEFFLPVFSSCFYYDVLFWKGGIGKGTCTKNPSSFLFTILSDTIKQSSDMLQTWINHELLEKTCVLFTSYQVDGGSELIFIHSYPTTTDLCKRFEVQSVTKDIVSNGQYIFKDKKRIIWEMFSSVLLKLYSLPNHSDSE